MGICGWGIGSLPRWVQGKLPVDCLQLVPPVPEGGDGYWIPVLYRRPVGVALTNPEARNSSLIFKCTVPWVAVGTGAGLLRTGFTILLRAHLVQADGHTHEGHEEAKT